ncbi:ABC transporter permease [Anditalea andensis]|uniref:ABC transporter permease n=1 Tax=Anditalea andensis TaxID=1048983 RepID=A0A074LP54_9BACT|nr:ABC transporter permease [Anditalea andensis]KEO75687.1 hypothetical protein EL17_21905 [Anditalea andensis]
MLKTYFKIAWRSLFRSKWIGVINISGLIIGITAALMLFLVVRYELSYDKFHTHFSQIYRIVTHDNYENITDYTSGVAYPVPDALMADKLNFKEVVPVISHHDVQVNILKENSVDHLEKYKTGQLFFSTSAYPLLFDLEFKAGSADLLDQPDNVLLTQSEADRFFGSWETAQGKVLQLTNGVTLMVGAVVADIPENSNFKFDIMVSYETLRSHKDEFGYDLEEWGSTGSNFQVYVLMDQDEDLNVAQTQLEGFSKKFFEGRGTSVRTHHLQAMSDIHFDPIFEPLSGKLIRKSTIQTLIIVGIFILIMASINFVNLSTSQSIGRSKEIGVRKVMGSSTFQIAVLSFGETFLTVVIASLMSFGLAHILLPFLDKIADVPDTISFLNPDILLFMFSLVLILTLLSGFYPALIISKFQPVKALKTRFLAAEIGGVSIRRSLVVLQFAIAQILMIGTVIAIRQMNLIQDTDLGFNKEAIYFIEVPSDNHNNVRIEGFKQELLTISGIKGASLASDVPSSGNNSASNFYFDNKNEDVTFPAFLKFADAAYFDLYEMEFSAGQGYPLSDTIRNVVINEAMARKLLIPSPEEAIGKTIRLGGSGNWVPITGVVKDFTVNSLREEIKQLVITTEKSNYSQVAVRLDNTSDKSTMSAIQDKFTKIYPEQIYSAGFLDESIAAFYESEQKLALVYKIFAVLAILISCIGLYGLVSFMVGQKVKEIGIRKVLGASITQITVMLSKEFILMVVLAFLIAIPLAYFMVQEWLASFAYKTPISIGLFLSVMVMSLLITAFTVGSKAIRAAMANPVDSLTDE